MYSHTANSLAHQEIENVFVFLFSAYNTVNSENKPRGLYFSKALFEGLIRRGLSMEGNLRLKNRLG